MQSGEKLAGIVAAPAANPSLVEPGHFTALAHGLLQKLGGHALLGTACAGTRGQCGIEVQGVDFESKPAGAGTHHCHFKSI